jgi:hypothetical protein
LNDTVFVVVESGELVGSENGRGSRGNDSSERGPSMLRGDLQLESGDLVSFALDAGSQRGLLESYVRTFQREL